MTALIASPNVDVYAGTLEKLGLASWILELIVNISVTAAIVARLWYMGKMVASVSTNGSLANAYVAPIFTIVESGALFAAVTIAMLVLYVVGSPLAVSSINIATQLAVGMIPFACLRIVWLILFCRH